MSYARSMALLNIHGFNVLHLPRPNDLISIRVAIEAGSTHEKNPADYGVAHYLEHIFFKGTKTKNFRELNLRMAALGGSNASTSRERTVFYINTILPRFEEASKLIAELLLDPLMDEAEFNKERNVIIEEFQNCKDEPGDYFHFSTYEHLFGPQGHHIVGTDESLANMTIQQLNNFRNRWYTKDNMVFIVCGNVEQAEVERVFEQALAIGKDSTPEKRLEEREPNSFNLGLGDKNFTHGGDNAQAYMAMYFRGQNAAERKAAGHTNGMFANAMGGGLYSVLGERIREELGLCYHIGMGHSGYDNAQSSYVYTMLQKKNIPLARQAVLEQMEKVRKEGFSQDLVDTVRSNTLYGLIKGAETSAGYASSFGDSYLKSRKTYSDDEFTLEYFKDQFEKVSNEHYIRHANWIGDQYNFVTMNGQ